MNIKSSAFALLAALSAASAFAANGQITEGQANAVKAGATEAAVVRALGKPLYTPHWLDGTHSLVYAVTDADDHSERAYVDVDGKGNVIDVQFGNDGGN